jgi:ATP-binding cassette subfamily B protein
MTAPGPAEPRRPVVATAWRLTRAEPRAYAAALAHWIPFHGWGLLTGFALKAVLDRIAADDGTTIWTALAILAGIEIGRWVLLVSAVVQWGGAWVGFETVPRVNLLRSLVADPGPAAGRLPGSPGEAVSRFRDDVRDLTQVADVWLDVTAAVVSTAAAVAILAAVDARITAFVVLPLVAALGLARWLGPRLKAWRSASRQATASVTAFLGDVFGAVLAIKAAGAEAATSRRFERLNAARQRAAVADEVGTQLVVSLSGLTGELAVGLVLLLAAPALRDGDLTVGDIGLFTTYVTVLASLPRWTGRLSSYHRQAEVGVQRLAELDAHGDALRAVRRLRGVDLRRGPVAAPAASAGVAAARVAFDRFEVRRLTARHGGPDGPGVVDVDIDVRAGQLTVVTGPVGSGKSTLLRAALGLIARESGELRWDGQPVAEPSTFLVPPRVAYLPQVPRLCSESLADAVLLGLPPDALEEAIALACLDDDVADMPDGLGTEVGPRGVRLSGGQVQRVGAARALARRPALLVVDDLSSALDVAPEQRLWDGLFADGGRTALVVSHRPQVLERADVVVELRHGRRVR